MTSPRKTQDRPRITLHLPNEGATSTLGARLAGVLRPGLVIFLSGELGTGKTTLVRGCLRALGYRGRVKSPTFALVELYEVSRLHLHHFDFYRFEDPQEWVDAGFRELFGGNNVCLVEWPERARDRLPVADLWIRLEHAAGERAARITAHTELGKQCLEELSP
ncbi:MAG TPA: tRNA (adenosine(37)-N6)-threonylcarbamoyltransferase complex ATPase subunit type 1 TsaE [Burkholderiales bacterium]|nr:tRNA (adenosine(37)-N6)-threonylcarbamoyltransferase complex ATPase subunit type 1 TsaE [Burkholderiales bacterium]